MPRMIGRLCPMLEVGACEEWCEDELSIGSLPVLGQPGVGVGFGLGGVGEVGAGEEVAEDEADGFGVVVGTAA